MITVEPAHHADIPACIEMLRHYGQATPWQRLGQMQDQEYIRQLLTMIIAGMGVVFIARRDGVDLGLLIAIRNSNIWDPTFQLLQELCYWIEPEHRGSRAGYRLIKAYQEYALKQQYQNKIQGFTISKMVNSPDLDYSRFGFERLEETWRSK